MQHFVNILVSKEGSATSLTLAQKEGMQIRTLARQTTGKNKPDSNGEVIQN